jgi:hypothetical protein
MKDSAGLMSSLVDTHEDGLKSPQLTPRRCVHCRRWERRMLGGVLSASTKGSSTEMKMALGPALVLVQVQVQQCVAELGPLTAPDNEE